MSKKTKIAKLKEQNRNLRNQIKIQNKGSLKKYGFNEKEPEAKQKQAIRKADKEYGIPETDRKLAALEVFNKHKKIIHEKIHDVLKWNKQLK